MTSLSKKPIGVEITDSAIKAIQLEKNGEQAKILKLSEVILAPGIVEQGRIKNEERLIMAFEELFSKAKLGPVIEREIVFGLPENQLYVHTFKIKSHKKKERNNLVLKEIKASIPLEKENLLFSYKMIKKKDKTEVLLIVAIKEAVLEWQGLFKKLNLEIMAFDVKSLAIFRTLFSEETKIPICTISIGATTTDIAIFDKTGLRHSHTINIGGKDFTKAIAKKLQIEFNQAEEKKQEVGLTDKSGQIFKVLDKILKPMIEEIKELLDYFEQTTKQKIKKVILVGGSSKLKRIVDYFNDNLSLIVKKATLGPFKKEMSLEHIESFGLALRNIDKKWAKDISIPIEEYFLSDWEQLTGSSISGFSAFSVSSRKQVKKVQSNKVMLITILIVSMVCLGSAYFYRNKQKNEKEQELMAQIKQYANTQLFDFKVPVIVDPSEYSTEKIRGRIITNIIQEAKDYDAAVLASKIVVTEEIESGEELLPEPINKLVDQDTVIFPIAIKWLAYSEEDASRLFLREVDKINEDNVDYILDKIEKTEIEATQNSNLYYMLGSVTISSSEPIGTES